MERKEKKMEESEEKERESEVESRATASFKTTYVHKWVA